MYIDYYSNDSRLVWQALYNDNIYEVLINPKIQHTIILFTVVNCQNFSAIACVIPLALAATIVCTTYTSALF